MVGRAHSREQVREKGRAPSQKVDWPDVSEVDSDRLWHDVLAAPRSPPLSDLPHEVTP
jgi:hypothetical protein